MPNPGLLEECSSTVRQPHLAVRRFQFPGFGGFSECRNGVLRLRWHVSHSATSGVAPGGCEPVSGVVMAVLAVITMEANLTEQAPRLREHSNLQ
jgi:hypothetical protein